jgi:hypothetical protein
MAVGCFQWITNLHEKILVKLLEQEAQKVVLESMVEMDMMVKMERMELVLYLKSRIINDMYHIMMVLLGRY